MEKDFVWWRSSEDPLQEPKTSRADWLRLNAVFGVAFAYCGYGALTGHLVIPHRYSHGYAVVAGPSAWTFVGGTVSLWIGVAVRLGLFNISRLKRKVRVECFLLFLGIVMLYGSAWLPSTTHVQ
jgi:hypothetical protein